MIRFPFFYAATFTLCEKVRVNAAICFTGLAGDDMNDIKSTIVTEKDLKTIIEFIESIQFGAVSIVIQNGKIVQIEKSEKVRLN